MKTCKFHKDLRGTTDGSLTPSITRAAAPSSRRTWRSITKTRMSEPYAAVLPTVTFAI